jgi:alcohol dehydrogenase class IV
LWHLETAVRDGQDRAARTAVAEGSLLSAMAFSQSGLGAVHGLAHPLGLMLGLPHGFTCAVLLPHILEINRPACEPALAELAGAAGIAGGAAGFIDTVQTLCRQLGIPKTFAAAGLAPGHFPAILKNCRSNSMSANPRPLSDAEILALLGQLTANERK